MSGMKIYVRNEAEKKSLIESYLEEDDRYLEALDKLREELTGQGIDITKGEGRRIFIRAVRRLNEEITLDSSPQKE